MNETPLSLLIYGLHIVLVAFLLIVFGEQFEFAAFFCLSIFCFSQALIQKLNTRKHIGKSKNSLEQQPKKSIIAAFLINGLACLVIGFFHTLGKLEFPTFIITPTWGNKYILYIRLVWLMAWALSSFIFYREELDKIKSKKQKISIKLNMKLVASHFNIIWFFPLSIPIFLSALEFLKKII